MFLFDLQTVGFWALKNATKISDIHTPGLGFLLDPVARNFRNKFELPKSHRVNRQKSTPTKNEHQPTAAFFPIPMERDKTKRQGTSAFIKKWPVPFSGLL
jgi:hypothetical protein